MAMLRMSWVGQQTRKNTMYIRNFYSSWNMEETLKDMKKKERNKEYGLPVLCAFDNRFHILCTDINNTPEISFTRAFAARCMDWGMDATKTIKIITLCNTNRLNQTIFI